MKRFIIIALISIFILGIIYAQLSTHLLSVQIRKLVVADSTAVGGTVGTPTGTFIWKIVKDTDLLIITASDTFVVDSVRSK